MKLVGLTARIVCLPLIAVLSLLILLMDLGMKLYCVAVSVFYTITGICFIIAVCTAQWNMVGIMTIFIGLQLIFAYGVAFMTAQVEVLRDRLKRFVFA